MSCKKPFEYALIVCLFLAFISCNKTEADAKKAAALTNKSISLTTEMELEKAEKAYKESQEIISKYKEHKHEEKFLEHYRRYRDQGKVRPVEEL